MENYISTARNGHQFIDFSRFARQSVFRSIGFFTFTKTKKVFPFFELQQPKKKKKINSIKEKRKSCLFFSCYSRTVNFHLRVSEMETRHLM